MTTREHLRQALALEVNAAMWTREFTPPFLAKLAGIDYGRLNRSLNKGREFGATELIDLCDALNISVGEIVERSRQRAVVLAAEEATEAHAISDHIRKNI